MVLGDDRDHLQRVIPRVPCASTIGFVTEDCDVDAVDRDRQLDHGQGSMVP